MNTDRNQLSYEDLSDAQTEQLEAAHFRYHRFLGHCGKLDAQAELDRVTYGSLLTLSPSGEGRFCDEKSVEFVMAVTGFTREICAAYRNC